jgi:two-component system response regulator FixJ
VSNLIAIIDDDESIRDSVKALLRSAGYPVMTFESAEVFLESGLAMGAACVILDVRMPGMDGPQLQIRLRNEHSRVPIIFITAHDDSPVRERVLRAGAVDVLNKPFAPAALLSTLQLALRKESQA